MISDNKATNEEYSGGVEGEADFKSPSWGANILIHTQVTIKS